MAVWLHGLSGSGKTTLLTIACRELRLMGYACVILDGDILRRGVSADLDYSPLSRHENIRRAASIARLLADQGLLVLCAFMTPEQSMRDLVRTLMTPVPFLEVHISCRLEICAMRDTKGIYSKYQEGTIKNLPGHDLAFDGPTTADLIVSTEANPPPHSAAELINFIIKYASMD